MQFFRNESGAVTVDWVVLTASVVGLGLASAAAVATGTQSLGDETNSALSDAAVANILPGTREELMDWVQIAGCPMGKGEGVRNFGRTWGNIDGESGNWAVLDNNGTGFRENSLSYIEDYYAGMTDQELSDQLTSLRSISGYGWDAETGTYDANAIFDHMGRAAARVRNLMVLECEIASRTTA